MIEIIEFTEQDKELFDSIMPGISSGSMNGVHRLSGTWSRSAVYWQARRLRLRESEEAQRLASELERIANEGVVQELWLAEDGNAEA